MLTRVVYLNNESRNEAGQLEVFALLPIIGTILCLIAYVTTENNTKTQNLFPIRLDRKYRKPFNNVILIDSFVECYVLLQIRRSLRTQLAVRSIHISFTPALILRIDRELFLN